MRRTGVRSLSSKLGPQVTLLWVMLGVGLIQFFVPFTSQIELIYCTFGAMLYSGQWRC